MAGDRSGAEFRTEEDPVDCLRSSLRNLVVQRRLRKDERLDKVEEVLLRNAVNNLRQILPGETDIGETGLAEIRLFLENLENEKWPTDQLLDDMRLLASQL